MEIGPVIHGCCGRRGGEGSCFPPHPGPSPSEDLIINTRDVNMTDFSLLSPMLGETLCVGGRSFEIPKEEN